MKRSRNDDDQGLGNDDDEAPNELTWKDDDFLAFEEPAEEDEGKKKKNEAEEDAYDSMDQSSVEDNTTTTDANHSIPPWVLLEENIHQTRHHKKNLHPLVQLHNEILQFVRLMEPLESEKVQRTVLIDELQNSVKKEFGENSQLLILGSQATGLFLPTSDIDLTLQYHDDTEESNESSYNPLHKKPIHRFGDLMKQPQWKSRLSYLETIESTRVPIVKMKFAESDIAVDVSFNQPNGVNAALLMKEYLQAMPPLRPLSIVLKYFLSARDLNEAYSGGIGSYLLQLLIVSFLQHRERQAFHDDMPLEYNLGALLLDFFELYGLDFNYIVTGLSVRFDGYYFQKTPESRPNCITVENPLDVTHDVGSSSYRFNMVQKSFAAAYKTLLVTLSSSNGTSRSILGSVLPTSSYMTSRLVVKRRDQALSAPRDTSDRALSAPRDTRNTKNSKHRK